MKIAKKLFALLIVCTIALSTVSGAYAASSFSDVEENHKYAHAISSLVSLDLLAGYEDGTFRPDDTITRAEFATVMTRALGMAKYVSNMDAGSIFSDMTNEDGSKHWSSGYVRFAYDTEIISGMGDGTFAPDNPVTYEQAIKMVVCTLGYGESAIEKGGWPQGYLEVATNDLGLAKNAAMSITSAPASRGIVAQIVYNALNVGLVEKSSSGQSVVTEKTILKDKLGVIEFKNYMITNVDGETTITSSTDGVNKGEILLEHSARKLVISYGNVMTSAQLKSYIGYYISGYYRVDEDEEYHLISVDMSSTKNMEITIDYSNIESYRNFKIEYWTNKDTDRSTKDAEILKDAQFIYNGMVYDYKDSGDTDESDLSRWLDPESEDFVYGSIRLLDSDGDALYDAVFVEDFEVYVVKSAPSTTDTITANNYVIYDYYNSGKSLRLDPMDEAVTINIKNAKTGAAVKVESLKAMNILAVAASLDGTMYNCYVATSNTVTGQITKMSDKQHLYTISNKEYELTEELEDAVDSGKITLEIGSNATFYLDHLGKIAAIKVTSEQTGNYGYITIGALTGTTSDVATVKLIALTGSPSTPTKTNLASKVKINGKNYTDPSSAIDALEDSASLIEANEDGDNAVYSQLVRFIKNSSGEITTLTTVKEGKDDEIEIGTNTDNSNLIMGAKVKNLRYNGSGNFGNEVFANSSTNVIVIPTDRSKDSEYKRYSGYSKFKTSSTYNVEAYDINIVGIASVLVVYGADTSTPVTSDTKVSIIKSKASKVNSITEEICYNIEVYEEGVLKNYETEDDSDKFAELEVGDIVRFGYNGDGHVNDVRVAVDSGELNFESKHDTTLYNGDYKFKTILGTVATKSDEIIMIAPEKVVYTEEVTDENGEVTPAFYSLDDSEKEGYMKSSSTKIYRVLVKGGEKVVEAATWDSIISYADVENNTASVAFAQAYVNNLKLVVVYIAE